MTTQIRWDLMAEPFSILNEELTSRAATDPSTVAIMDQGMAGVRDVVATFGLDMHDEGTVYVMCATAAIMMTLISEGIANHDAQAGTDPMVIMADMARDVRLSCTALAAFRLFAPEHARRGQT